MLIDAGVLTTHRQADMAETSDINLDGLSVMIGIPTNRDFPSKTVKCMLETQRVLDKMGIPNSTQLVSSGCVINGRDDVADQFLQSDHNRLFWIDSDMAWHPTQFMRMLALSQQEPVICAAYPAKVGPRPTFFIKFEDDRNRLEPDRRGLAPIKGLGLGFTVIQREVIQKLAAKSQKILDEMTGRKVPNIFKWEPLLGKRCTEDMRFFYDIQDMGYKVLLDTTINLGHIGPKEFTGNIRDAFGGMI